MQKKIAMFASGAGSNAKKIIEHLTNNAATTVSMVVCNKPGAGVLDIAAKAGIATHLINKKELSSPEFINMLMANGTRLIVLAGFLLKIPRELIQAFPGRIINIHPALLPKYGGKGMYGYHVHEAVINNGEKESGITIHYVDELYDHGATIFQAVTEVLPTDTPETLAAKIHALEHAHFPKVVEDVAGRM